MDNSSLDIIVPCFNPPFNWEKELCDNVAKLKGKLPDININIILINDGSKTGINKDSISLIKKQVVNFKYINYPVNRGKGFALRKGVLESSSTHLIFTDIDFPYELDSILRVYSNLNNGIDVVVGNRDLDYYKKTPFIRTLISKTFRFILKTFLQLKVTDTQCGLKGFNKKGKAEFLKTTIDRFLFDLEFVKRCSQNNNIKIKAVAVTLKEGVIFSQMNFKILAKEFLNFLVILVKK